MNDPIATLDVSFDISKYRPRSRLRDNEQRIVANRSCRSDWPYLLSTVPDIVTPLIDVVERSGVPHRLAVASIAAVLWQVSKLDTLYWNWSEDEWTTLINARAGSRPATAAIAYQLGRFRNLQDIANFRHSAVYASAIFTPAVFNQALARLSSVLVSLGYLSRNLEERTSSVLGALMIENGDPRLETFNEELLIRCRSHRSEAVSRSVGMVSHGLAAMGIVPSGLRMRGYTSWRERCVDGIHPLWVEWSRRWRDTSTLRPRTRESNYSFILRTGLWLAKEHPSSASPADWKVTTCAEFVAAVDRMTVGEWSLQSAVGTKFKNRGNPIAANSKRSILHSLRRLFIDIELWGWAKLAFSPRYHLATPHSVAFNSGVNPRVIDDSYWLKLIWASLHLQREDLPSGVYYPLTLVQAVAVVWTHAGLRRNEITRLSAGCAHAQTTEVMNEDGTCVPSGTLCYLDIPASKTFKAYVKPVASIVKERIDAWLNERPSQQAALLDERTGEKVNYLFQLRGKRLGTGVINSTIIPLLCKKAGVPLEDSRGRITSHRGRASAVTALASVPQGMSLIELMQWSGHSSPRSTLHYIRIKPTKLAASFAKADRMSQTISVLIDHDVIQQKENVAYAFYDLGDSYCANPFWSSCPHRMACAGCDFNVPKVSARGRALEHKEGVRRYLETVPLTDEEKAIAEGDLEKLNSLIQKLDDVPTLDGRTPRQIVAGK